MSKFNLLIIDDDPSRKGDFQNIFNDSSFNIEYAFDRDIFFQTHLNNFDCFIVDISLDNWTTESAVRNMFMRVINYIGKQKPIILLSSKIQEVIDWSNELLKESFQLIYTIALEELTTEQGGVKVIKSRETSQIVCNNIYTLLSQKLKYSTLKKEDNDDINILHISDLQFGDNSFDDGLSFAFPDVLYRYLNDKLKINIDFVIVTGDISYNGSPSQYEKAFEWFSKIGNRLFNSESFNERFLIVPGNHDVNLSLCSLNVFKYQFPKENVPIGDIQLSKRDDVINEYTMYALDAFRDFAYKLTNDNNWLSNQQLSFFNNKFNFLGFRFLLINALNPYNLLGKNSSEFEVNVNSLEELSIEANHQNKNIPTIVLTHPSPSCLGFNLDGNSSDNWRRLSSLLVSIDSKLFLYGHTHNNLPTEKMRLSEGKSIIRSSTGTLFTEPGNVGETRSFKIITLKRNANKVINYIEKSYILKTNSTIIPDGEEFESNEGWI